MSNYSIPDVPRPPKLKNRRSLPPTTQSPFGDRKPSPPRHFIFPDVAKPCTPCTSRTQQQQESSGARNVRAPRPPSGRVPANFQPMATSSPLPWVHSQQHSPPPESWSRRPGVVPGTCPALAAATGNLPTLCSKEEEEYIIQTLEDKYCANDRIDMNVVAREMDKLRRELRQERDKILFSPACKDVNRDGLQCSPSPSTRYQDPISSSTSSDYLECEDDRTTPPQCSLEDEWYTPPQSPQAERHNLEAIKQHLEQTEDMIKLEMKRLADLSLGERSRQKARVVANLQSEMQEIDELNCEPK